MGELDGEWEVRRVGGLLPPLYGFRKRIDGGSGLALWHAAVRHAYQDSRHGPPATAT